MKRFINTTIGFLFLLRVAEGASSPVIQEFPLDEHRVYAIPVSTERVTTFSFPGPISAIDAAQVTVDGKAPALFQIAHTKGSHFFSARALARKAKTNVNIRWNNKTYVLELSETNEPFYSVIFQVPSEPITRRETIAVTPNRLLSLMDKARSYRLLKQNHPDAVAGIDYTNYSQKPRVMDFKTYDVQLDEVFRFNAEDTFVFCVTLRNKTDQPLQYKPDGFSLRVGDRVYPQSISDASGSIPAKGEVPACFAVTGTPNGGRNEISVKNEFTVILNALPVEAKKEEQQ